MGLLKLRKQILQNPSVDDSLDPVLLDGNDLARLSDKGLRALQRLEASGPAHSERAVRIAFSRKACPAVSENLEDIFRVICRHIDNDLIQHRVLLGLQHAPFVKLETPRDIVVESELRLVEVRVSRIDADIVFQQFFDHPALHIVRIDVTDPLKNKRMMRNDHIEAAFAGLVDHFLRHVQR